MAITRRRDKGCSLLGIDIRRSFSFTVSGSGSTDAYRLGVATQENKETMLTNAYSSSALVEEDLSFGLD